VTIETCSGSQLAIVAETKAPARINKAKARADTLACVRSLSGTQPVTEMFSARSICGELKNLRYYSSPGLLDLRIGMISWRSS
jgi:hypothetical protein